MGQFVIRGAKIGDLKGYHACLGIIAAERKYVGMVKASPLASFEKVDDVRACAEVPILVVTQQSKIVEGRQVRVRKLDDTMTLFSWVYF